MPMLLVGETRAVQVVERGVDVHEHAVVGQTLEQRHHLAEVVVGSGASAGAVEDRRRDRVISLRGESPRDVFDVLVHAEGFLDHDDRTCGRPLGCSSGIASKTSIGPSAVDNSIVCVDMYDSSTTWR